MKCVGMCNVEQGFPQCDDCGYAKSDRVVEYYIFRTEGSHDRAMWWRPNSRGYTTNIQEAGKYTKEKAFKIELESGGEDFAVPDYIIAEMPKVTIIEAGIVGIWRYNEQLARSKSGLPPPAG